MKATKYLKCTGKFIMALRKRHKIYIFTSLFIFCTLILLYMAVRNIFLLCFCLLAVCAVFALVYFGIRHCRYDKGNTAYVIPEGQKLLVVVPHPDDELNLAGVLIRNVLMRRGEAYIIYTTNFDVYGKRNAYKRLSEIKKLCKRLSISYENVFYMGYHAALHNAVEIKNSIKYTYALNKEKTCAMRLYGKEVLQTFDNMENILHEMIMQIRPDIICGIDYDSHADHRIASDALENAISRLKQMHMSYSPLVLKGFSYATAWMSVPDFYKNDEYLDSSVSNHNKSSETSRYNWEARVRLPYINNADLGHTLRSSYLYKLYSTYMSQNALCHMNQIVNGDQIFWKLSSSDTKTFSVFKSKIKYYKISLYPDKTFLYELFYKPDKRYKLCVLNEKNIIEKDVALHLYFIQNNKEKELYGIDGIYTVALNGWKGTIVCKKGLKVVDTISLYSNKSMKFFVCCILRKSELMLDWFLKRFRTHLYSYRIEISRKLIK